LDNQIFLQIFMLHKTYFLSELHKSNIFYGIGKEQK